MKKILIIGIMLIASIAAKSQARFVYSYDNNGNRYQRLYFSQKKTQDTTSTDSTAATAQVSQPVSQIMPNGQKITIYPNPTSGMLQIDITNFATGSKGYIIATDLQGRVIYKNENVNSTNKIDFTTLATGNYTVKLVLNDISKEWVIVKE